MNAISANDTGLPAASDMYLCLNDVDASLSDIKGLVNALSSVTHYTDCITANAPDALSIGVMIRVIERAIEDAEEVQQKTWDAYRAISAKKDTLKDAHSGAI